MTRRSGDRRVGRANFSRGRTLREKFRSLFAGRADAVYLESDNYNAGAGTWTDKIDPSHVMTATGVIPAPTVVSPFAGASMAFTATQYLTSNRLAARFINLHNGLGGSVLAAYSMTNISATSFLWNTYTSGVLPGAYQVACASTVNVQWAQVKTGGDAYNVTRNVTSSNVGVGVKTLTELYCSTAASPQNEFVVNGSSATAAYSSAADLGANLQTLMIGSLSGGALPLSARLRAFYFLPYALSTNQKLIARAYMATL